MVSAQLPSTGVNGALSPWPSSTRRAGARASAAAQWVRVRMVTAVARACCLGCVVRRPPSPAGDPAGRGPADRRTPAKALRGGEGGVFLTFARSLSSASDLYDALYAEREEIAKVAPGVAWRRDANGKVWIQAPPIPLGDLEDPAARQTVVRYIAAQTNAMVNAFRHRLERLCKERATGT